MENVSKPTYFGDGHVLIWPLINVKLISKACKKLFCYKFDPKHLIQNFSLDKKNTISTTQLRGRLQGSVVNTSGHTTFLTDIVKQ